MCLVAAVLCNGRWAFVTRVLLCLLFGQVSLARGTCWLRAVIENFAVALDESRLLIVGIDRTR